MGWFKDVIDFFLHLDRTLGNVIKDYQSWTYLILFLVIFCETGLVVTPFLPGDSLLFAAGAFAALGKLNLALLLLILAAAAILGDTANYWVGHTIGEHAFQRENARILKKKYLDETHAFYEKYGGATIVLARFVPIVRTFAPFVAGVGEMTYMHFLLYNVVGGIAWVFLFVLAGYFFGNIDFIKHNFSYVIVAIVLISVLPIAIKALTDRRKRRISALQGVEEADRVPVEGSEPEGDPTDV